MDKHVNDGTACTSITTATTQFILLLELLCDSFIYQELGGFSNPSSKSATDLCINLSHGAV